MAKKKVSPLNTVLETLATVIAGLQDDISALYQARVPMLERLEALEKKVAKLEKRKRGRIHKCPRATK
jgi:hypothetical protein